MQTTSAATIVPQQRGLWRSVQGSHGIDGYQRGVQLSKNKICTIYGSCTPMQQPDPWKGSGHYHHSHATSKKILHRLLTEAVAGDMIGV